MTRQGPYTDSNSPPGDKPGGAAGGHFGELGDTLVPVFEDAASAWRYVRRTVGAEAAVSLHAGLIVVASGAALLLASGVVCMLVAAIITYLVAVSLSAGWLIGMLVAVLFFLICAIASVYLTLQMLEYIGFSRTLQLLRDNRPQEKVGAQVATAHFGRNRT